MVRDISGTESRSAQVQKFMEKSAVLFECDAEPGSAPFLVGKGRDDDFFQFFGSKAAFCGGMIIIVGIVVY